jgi:hypothetical protein
MKDTVSAVFAALLAASLGTAIYFFGWYRGTPAVSENHFLAKYNYYSTLACSMTSAGDALGNLVREFRLGSVSDLRLVLQQTGACIAGSTTLYLLRPGRFVPNDIDFYVKPLGFPLLLEYMINHDYKVSTTIRGPHMQLPTATTLGLQEHNYKFHANHIAVLLDMHHRSSPSLKINLVVSRAPHIVSTITKFHSTIVMNYLAWYGLVSLYPRWTMQNVGLINRRNLGFGIVEKYRGRGFALCSSMDVVEENHVCLLNAYCPQHPRSLHDTAHLFLPFGDISSSLSALEPDVPWVLNVLCVSFNFFPIFLYRNF